MGNFKTNQSIAEVLQSSDVLCRFAKQLQTIEKLNAVVKQCLPEPLNAHCWVANLNQNILIIATSSPTWKHQLHYQKTELLSKLRTFEAGCGIRSIQIMIQPESLPPPEVRKAIPPSLNDSNRQAILTMAEHVEHPELKAALTKLAKASATNQDCE